VAEADLARFVPIPPPGCTVRRMPTDHPVVANLATVWHSIDGLLAGMDEKDWNRPTDCPGWTVKDHVSHVIGTESALLGRPAPPPVGEVPEHVKNPMGELNEAWVEARRVRSPAEVLAEFREVTAARLTSLRSMTDDEMAAITPGPTGQVPYEEFMRIRVMDNWVHEQDIRRAVGQPGDLDGPVAEASLARFTSALPFVISKRAGAPEGATVVLQLAGPGERALAASVASGRGRLVDGRVDDPTVRLRMTPETYARLSCGRLSPSDALAGGQVSVEGDRTLGERVLAGMSIMP
jgi:uncharacterized protein (TIGR03083 family)